MPISVTAYVICFLHPCVVMHLALVKSELLKSISESLYPFEFQINKLIKYFKEKKNHLRTTTHTDNSTIQIVKFIGNVTFPVHLIKY